MKDFRTALAEQVILFDGAMGSEIYRRGVYINRSFEELSLDAPDMIRSIHRSYLEAGAEVLTTNTFGGNPIRMQEFGLEARFEEMNRAAVQIARSVAGDAAWVAASMGPVGQSLKPVGRLDPGQVFKAFSDQAKALLQGQPDLFILETFYEERELWQAVRAVRAACRLPIVACMSFAPIRGEPPQGAVEALVRIASWPVDAVGSNCAAGPRTLLELVEQAAPLIKKPMLAMPNAGQPQTVEGRQLYMASPEYMAEYARRFVQKGARLVGGCCGTTPETIRVMRSFIRSAAPQTVITPERQAKGPTRAAEPTPVAERTPFAKKLYSGKFCISVELDPPRGLDPARSLEGAAFLKEKGVDVINIADGPRAVARMGPLALAVLARDHCGMESVIHYCCRDRNLLGMQMDLIGANALGLRNILAVTGDPPKMGTYPNATAVFDIDSIGLITFIQMLNRGLDFSGRPLSKQEEGTSLFVGAGCNPAHVDLDLEVSRFEKKVEAGAEYFFSQPVYDEEVLFHFLERTESCPKVPFLAGVLPLASYKNAEFLHNEVPGMQVPASIRERLKKARTRQEQREIGIEVARATLKAAYEHPRINGAYIYPPFGSYEAVMRVVEGFLD